MDETAHPESAETPGDADATRTLDADATSTPGDDATGAAGGDTGTRGGATIDEDPQHDCQVPREDAPEVGGEWRCPECGTWWRLESAEEHPEHLPERRDQRVNWYRMGKRGD